MASNLDIVNMALAHLAEITAQKRMTVFARSGCNTDPQHACLDFYEACQDEMLAYMDWPRAQRRIALTVSSADPIISGKWTYKYARPDDCLIVRAIIDTDETEYKWDEGAEAQTGNPALSDEWIYTNLEDAYLRYTYRLDESRYTVGMAMLHSMLLAERVCMTVTAKPQIVQMITTKLHGRIETLAQKLGASEGYVKDEHGESLMTDVY